MKASLSVEDRKVLPRSTEAKPNTADSMDQWIGLAAINLPANAADVDIDDIGRRIKVQIPYFLQKHSPRDHLTGIASQICQEFELSRQQVDFLATPTSNPRQQIDLQIADPQHRFPDDGSAATCERIDTRHHLLRGEGFYQVVVAPSTQPPHAIIDLAEGAEDQRRRGDP